MVDDATLVEFFERTHALMGVHAEDETMLQASRLLWQGRTPLTHHETRPASAAVTAVERLVELTRAHPRPVHICHVSTEAEVALLETVRGVLPITLEVSPHHLWLNSEQPLGNFGKVNPPLRPESDRRAMWAAVRRGLVDTIGSDHAPHTREEKELPYSDAPAGIPGVEFIFSLMLSAVRTGRVGLERVVQLCAEAPAARFGFARKGRIAVGADADILVFREGELERLTADSILTRVGWSPYLGQNVAPKPEMVFVGGRMVSHSGVIVDEASRGSLVSPSREA